jgi:hypothetical protein
VNASNPTLSEAGARDVLLVRAFETGPDDNPQWTQEDRAWATRLAREADTPTATDAQFLQARARHALQRLAPRDVGVAREAASRRWRASWVGLALLAGLCAGVAVDAIGSSQRINLLAPPVWAVIAWNGLVYVSLLLPTPLGAKAWLVRRLAGQGPSGTPMARFHAAWAVNGAPLLRARAALLLHVASAAVALGLIGGLYLRGLVLDYRAGWQSTFLDAAQVHWALSTLLAPAVLVTGIAVPDMAALQALRVSPEALPVASAAPWIHLIAALLVLWVVLPRTALALTVAWRSHLRAGHLLLPLPEPYYQALLRERRGHVAQVQVLPHGSAVTPHALACLRAVLAGTLGSGLQLSATAATAYGDEESAALLNPSPGTTLRLALVDLAATPEDDTHGAFLLALRSSRGAALPLVLVADETAFRHRMASLPERLAERRAAWQRWAAAQGVGLLCVDLAQPDEAGAARALRAALQT